MVNLSHANRFATPSALDSNQSDCVWPECQAGKYQELHVCYRHAMRCMSYLREEILTVPKEREPERQGFVYYLMVGPSTVKIGTTKNLIQRLRQMRTDVQYVVAIEPGSYDLERQRHKEFNLELINRREDFMLSKRLKHHIESLMPQRDYFVNLAIDPPTNPAWTLY